MSVDEIVEEAIALTDAEALDAVTLRRVAPMILYTYVPGKAELLDLMLDAIYSVLHGLGVFIDRRGT